MRHWSSDPRLPSLCVALAAALLLAPVRHVPAQAPAAAAAGAARLPVDSALARRLAGSAPAGITGPAWSRAARLYDAEGMRPLWLDAQGRLTERGAALVEALAGADRHGLALGDYPLPALARVLDGLAGAASPARVADADALLTAAYAQFGQDVLTGRVDPRRVEPDWRIDARTVDVDSALAAVLRGAGGFARALETLRPRQDGYDGLMRALERYRRLADEGGWPEVPAGPLLRVDDRDPRVPALRRRLAAEGYAPAAAAADSAALVYDPALAGVVARFQTRHGLTVDSVVGPRTRAALNVSAGRRVAQLAANLERLRWLPALGDRFVLVNVPAFRLDAFDGGERTLSMRVVVGSELEDRHTPVFSDSMEYVQFGPYWNVPRSIATEEILPDARRDRGYLERNDYEMVRGWGDDAPVVSPWSLSNAALFSTRYRVRQRPGPQNALGRVKFMFPNDYAVYLHDTPARSLFDDAHRAHSHGCVRVADPAALAEFVLAAQPEWDRARIERTLAAGERVRVELRRKLPVYLVYLTAFARDGEVAFRRDVYSMDAALIRALGDAAADGTTRAAAGRLATLAARS